ncbi:MAG: hypothetical protein O3C57_00275, partial [Verrucomicrobia bacterium]|nr:hypothetical protein [Verrucomicrobiota bacterium]
MKSSLPCSRFAMISMAMLSGITMSFAGGNHADPNHVKHEHEPAKNAVHDHKSSGPNGGRIITTVKPHLEFLVTQDRNVKITALDAQNQ